MALNPKKDLMDLAAAEPRGIKRKASTAPVPTARPKLVTVQAAWRDSPDDDSYTSSSETPKP